MLIFCDGFDHYTTAQATSGQKWDTITSVGSSSVTISATAARTGGQGAILNWQTLFKSVPNQVTYVVGMAFQLKTADATGGFATVLAFSDGGTAQVFLSIDSGGHIVAHRGGTVLGTSTGTVSLSQYRYLEAKLTVGTGTSGALVVRVDGSIFLNLTGINTQNTANTQINIIGVGLNTQFGVMWIDDVYICDTTTPNTAGNNNADFLGDVKVTALYPNAAGAFTQYTRGGTNTGQDYSQVNEATPDEDTTYVVDSTVNDRDSFKFTSISLVGSIFAAVLWSRARKDDASVRTLANVARSSAVDQVGANYNLASAYQYYGTVFELDPATTVLWTTTGLNLAEFGVKTIA